MAKNIFPEKSARHGIPFAHIPTIRGSIYGGSIVKHYPDSYSAILDCVYEMADMVATGNGISIQSAIDLVCADEGWRVLPRHKALIRAMLEVDRTPAIST